MVQVFVPNELFHREGETEFSRLAKSGDQGIGWFVQAALVHGAEDAGGGEEALYGIEAGEAKQGWNSTGGLQRANRFWGRIFVAARDGEESGVGE